MTKCPKDSQFLAISETSVGAPPLCQGTMAKAREVHTSVLAPQRGRDTRTGGIWLRNNWDPVHFAKWSPVCSLVEHKSPAGALSKTDPHPMNDCVIFANYSDSSATSRTHRKRADGQSPPNTHPVGATQGPSARHEPT